MNDFFLDLKDKPRVVDFLVDASAFADADARDGGHTWSRLDALRYEPDGRRMKQSRTCTKT
jgi:hypothetical protein